MSDSTPRLQLFNTLSGKQEDFIPLSPGKVRMYVCGPTVYDDAHLGHARCYITWDVLYRFLKFLNYDVTYVRNVTDVDDKILNRAKDLGQLPKDVAEKNYQSFKEDMQALNVLTPDVEPKATEYIDTMIEVIEGLIQKDAAYVAPDGTVYFRVSADDNYGQLSKKPLDELKSGARVEVDPHKENPLDFALWKSVPPEEQTDEKLAQGFCFESPWGRGRPGWHIECSAMNYKVLGPQIDIHAGGADLVFPHHENEIAQTETWQGLAGGPEESHADHRFAKYWMHNGFVNVSGEKMGKSVGNFTTIKKVLERYDANTIRYFLLTNGYRMPVDFSDDALQGAQNRILKIKKYLQKAFETSHHLNQEAITINCLEKEPVYRFYAGMLKKGLADDLNTAAALFVIDLLIGKLNDISKMSDPNYFPMTFEPESEYGRYDTLEQFYPALYSTCLYLMSQLGFDIDLLLEKPKTIVFPKDEIRTIYKELSGKWLEPDRKPEVLLAEIVEYRKKAKEIKNWTQADAIRKHLTDIGLQILDNKDGTTTVEKDGLEIVRV